MKVKPSCSAVIVVAEYRRGGESLNERRNRMPWKPKSDRWWVWVHGGKGTNRNNTVTGMASLGLVLMCVFTWIALTD